MMFETCTTHKELN